MANERFQLSVMNDTEPSARDVAAFERDLKTAQGRASCSTTSRRPTKHVSTCSASLRARPTFPVVGVTETRRRASSYQEWMLDQLDDTKGAGGPIVVKVIELDHATMRSAGVTVLADTSFAIGARRVHRRPWPNGAGKTTLMRAILGLLAAARRQLARASTSRRGAATRRSAICRKCARSLPDLRCAASISSPAPCMASAGPCPSRPAPIAADRRDTGDRRRERTRRPALSDMSGGERQRLLSPRRLSATRNSCCSTSRSSALINAIRRR